MKQKARYTSIKISGKTELSVLPDNTAGRSRDNTTAPSPRIIDAEAANCKANLRGRRYGILLTIDMHTTSNVMLEENKNNIAALHVLIEAIPAFLISGVADSPGSNDASGQGRTRATNPGAKTPKNTAAIAMTQ